MSQGPRATSLRRLPHIVAWTVLPLLAVSIIAIRYHRTWYFYDEWGLIRRIINTRESFAGHVELYVGHLWLTNHLLYEIQVFWFGTSNHLFIWAMFCASIVLLVYAVSFCLLRLGVPSIVALAGGLVVGLFGPGGGLVSFEIDVGTILATALIFLAAAIVSRESPETSGEVVIVTLVLLLAVVSDSSVTLIGLLPIGALLIVQWSRRHASIALLPTLLVGLWTLTQTLPRFSAPTIAGQVNFGFKLLFGTAGGLVHGGPVAGGVMLALAIVVITIGWRRGALGRRVKASLVGALASVAVLCASLAWSRSLYPLTPGIRYFAEVAVFLLVGLLPALWSSVASLWDARRRGLPAAAALALLAVLLFNLGPLLQNEVTIESWASSVRQEFPQAVWIAEFGCPNGQAAKETSRPIGSLSPQITVAMIRDLRHLGLFTSIAPSPPSATIISQGCP